MVKISKSFEKFGFSIIEVILAVSIFGILVAAIIGALIYGRQSTALSGTRSRAVFLAEEGIEASRNIRDSGFGNLAVGAHGLATSPSGWVFSGVQDATDIFTRQVEVASINTQTKIVTSTITWQQTESRNGRVVLSTRLTNWARVGGRGGMLVYADFSGNDDVIRYKILDGSSNWGGEQTVPAFGVPGNRATRRIEIYSSPVRNEKIMITKHFDSVLSINQYLYAQIWNGSVWGNAIQLSFWANATRPDVRDFDGAYLANGNFMLVYEDNTNIPKYRIWNGISWSAQGATLNVGGNPDWIVVRSRPGTSEAMVATFDAVRDTNTLYWNGSSWGGLLEHGAAAAGSQFEGVDFTWVFGGASGALIFNEASDNNPNIRIWNGSAWSANVENINIGGVARASQIKVRPNASEFWGCFKDSVNDINCLEGSTVPLWSTLTNGEIAANTDIGTQRSFSLDYEAQSGNLGLVVYSNGASAAAQAIPKYRTFNPAANSLSVEFSLADLGGAGASLEVAELIPDPLGDDILVILGTTDNDVWTAVWDGSGDQFYSTGGRGQVEHGISGTQDTDFWFDFAWDGN